MAIFGLDTKSSEIDQVVRDKEDKSLVPLYQSERIDDRVRAFLEGYKWRVTYFHRVIDTMDQITEYDPNLTPDLQDYVRIDNLTLYLESPLPASIPDDLAGTCLIDINMDPNPNDLFIAKLLDGKAVIFVIEDVTRISYNNDNLFQVTFKVYAEYDSLDDKIFKTLQESTTEELIYNEKYRLTADQPLYTKDEFEIRKDVYSKIDKLITLLDNKFISYKTQFFYAYLDDEKNIVYDPNMFEHIKTSIGLTYFKNKPERVNIKDPDLTILDYMLNLNISELLISENVEITSTGDKVNSIYVSPYLDNTIYTRIGRIVNVTTEPKDYKDNGEINEIFPYIPDGKYIFRKEIYNVIKRGKDVDADKLTLFEKVFLSFMAREPIEYNDLLVIYENLIDLPAKELFYFAPIYLNILHWYVTTFTVPFI